MTREQAKKMWPIIQAYAEGRTIQCRGKHQPTDPPSEWVDADESPMYFEEYQIEFRIKPKPREFWIHQSKDGGESTMLFAYKSKPKPSESNWELIHVIEVLN